MTENTIIVGDCRELIDSVPSDAFIVSDPPYNQNYHYSTYADTLKTEDYLNLLGVFKNRQSIVISYPEETINLMGGYLGKAEQVVSWVYPSNTMKQHRLITWFNCKPDMRKITQPYKNPTDKRIVKRIAEGKACKIYDWWEINQVKNVSKKDNPHPCPIPMEIAKRIILLTTKEGDLVVDPFAGSGTVLFAAKMLGRRYLGFDVDAGYVKYANQKLRELSI
jgi:site-specific DNA-methyltransferase (adenine-specific)